MNANASAEKAAASDLAPSRRASRNVVHAVRGKLERTSTLYVAIPPMSAESGASRSTGSTENGTDCQPAP